MDRSSSPTTVYLRRNIIRKEPEEGEDQENQTAVWQYEERELTKEEYEQMLLMQQVVAEKTEGIAESVTQFQKNTVIDEYTMQLIEEGII